jgi:hypothetical protein
MSVPPTDAQYTRRAKQPEYSQTLRLFSKRIPEHVSARRSTRTMGLRARRDRKWGQITTQYRPDPIHRPLVAPFAGSDDHQPLMYTHGHLTARPSPVGLRRVCAFGMWRVGRGCGSRRNALSGWDAPGRVESPGPRMVGYLPSVRVTTCCVSGNRERTVST